MPERFTVHIHGHNRSDTFSPLFEKPEILDLFLFFSTISVSRYHILWKIIVFHNNYYHSITITQ
jgi:hypothetical protein